jgi:putative ABC transport system permease protein
VADAQPLIEGFAQIVGTNGKAVTGNGPRAGGNWLGSGPLNPYRLVAGHEPRSVDEVVIDKATADASGLHPGTRTSVLAPGPHPVTIVGVATFGRSDAFGGTSYVGFTLPAAQQYLTKPGQVSSIQVRAALGTSAADLVRRLTDQLPDGLQVVTGAAAAEEATKVVDDGFLTIFKMVLSGLAGLSLLVAIFTVFNTQSILAAQRTRESALLRALGASRRQVLAGAIGEAAVVGVIASALGVGGGILLTLGLKGIFASQNVTLPGSGLALRASGPLIAFGVGVLVTVLASLVPARRAAIVAPLAALRAAQTTAVQASRRRLVIGALGLVAGLVVTGSGLLGAGVLAASIGALLVVAAVITLGPSLAGPAVRMLAAPWARRRGNAAQLASRNAQRDPHRVSSAATALLVGCALVSLATVLAASLRASADTSVAGSLRADLVVSPSNSNGAPASLSPDVVTTAARTPGVAQATALGEGTVLVDGSSMDATVVDPSRLSGLVALDVRAGKIDGLTGDAVAVRRDLADERHWRVGSSLAIVYRDGRTERGTVGAIFAGQGVVHDLLLPTTTWSAHSPQLTVSNVLIDVASGSSARQVSDRLNVTLAAFGKPPVRDKAGFIADSSSMISTALNLVYVMLALAIIIAVLGIANTISLSVFERTRELGLLRAVGLTRRQTRTAVRIEAVLVAALGSIAGVALGALGGAAVVASADSATLSRLAVPPMPLVIVLLGGALSGVLAAARPARRAARLDVLTAIAAT